MEEKDRNLLIFWRREVVVIVNIMRGCEVLIAGGIHLDNSNSTTALDIWLNTSTTQTISYLGMAGR